MNEACDWLRMLKQRPQAVSLQEMNALLTAAGFQRKLRLEHPIPFYVHPQLPRERLTLRVDISGNVSAGAVEAAFGAVGVVVVCDDD